MQYKILNLTLFNTLYILTTSLSFYNHGSSSTKLTYSKKEETLKTSNVCNCSRFLRGA